MIAKVLQQVFEIFSKTNVIIFLKVSRILTLKNFNLETLLGKRKKTKTSLRSPTKSKPTLNWLVKHKSDNSCSKIN